MENASGVESDMSKNYGLILKPRAVTDFQFGGVTGLSADALLPGGDWTSYLSQYEPQSKPTFDTMACVTFSALNCLETLGNLYGWQLNRSDRFTAKMSGTTMNGNDFTSVAESIRKLHGTLDEVEWPFTANTFEEYYTTIPLPSQNKARHWLEEYVVGYEYVWDTPESLIEGLKRGPLQVAIYAYGPLVNDVYQRSEKRATHAVMLFKAVSGDHWLIYDHYARQVKKLAWDTRFWGALRYSITLKGTQPMPALNLPKDTLVQLVEGTGGFGLYTSGKLYIDDTAKILASWVVRNNGKTEGKVVAVTLKDWNAWPHFNLKNESII